MNAKTFIKDTVMKMTLPTHSVEILKRVRGGVNKSAELNDDQQRFVLNAIGGIKTELQGNPSKSEHELALQIATYINTCRE